MAVRTNCLGADSTVGGTSRLSGLQVDDQLELGCQVPL